MTSAPLPFAHPTVADRHYTSPRRHPRGFAPIANVAVPDEVSGFRLVAPDAIPPGADVLAVLVRDPAAGSRPTIPSPAGRDRQPPSGIGPHTVARNALARNDIRPEGPALITGSTRAAERPGAVIAGPGLLVDDQSRLVYLDDREVDLTRREFDLLLHLARNPGRVHSRELLLATVWGLDDARFSNPRTVDVHVARLRRKLGHVHGNRLETLRGVGYRWSRQRPAAGPSVQAAARAQS
jgi:DNA-binding winged helix-turn-helix (wHTH) protein